MRTVMLSNSSKISGFSLQNICLDQGLKLKYPSLFTLSKRNSGKVNVFLMHFEVYVQFLSIHS